MKMKFKKETKHTVVYEVTEATKEPAVRSVYVEKDWLTANPSAGEKHVSGWPAEIELEVRHVG